MPGDGNAVRFRGFEIDNEGKLARLLDREMAGPGASKDFRDIGARMAKAVHEVAGIGRQQAKHPNSSERLS